MTARRAADERGFTLIEMAFAIGIFGAVIIGLSFVFQGAFRTVNQVRYEDVARTLAQEKMEEIRSLPFFVSQQQNAADVDVLDRYFPRAANGTTPTGASGVYDGTTGTWTFTSTEAPLDQGDAPPFTRSVAVQFVATAPTGGLVPIAPRSGYDSDVATADEPAADAAKVTVTIVWTESGQQRSIELDTVIARTAQDQPKVEASGSALGALVSGLSFRDGDDGGLDAAVEASVATARIEFREVTGPTAQAAADPIQVTESDPVTNVAIQPAGPSDGASTTTVPNSTTGNTQAGSGNLAAGSVSSINDPVSVIAAWGDGSTSTSESRVSPLHSQNPESRAQAAVSDVLVNGRELGEEQPHAMMQLGLVSGVVEERSTTGETTVTSAVDIQPSGVLPGATFWGAPQFVGDPRFEGVVTIQSLHVDVRAEAGSTTSATVVNWRVDGFRIWDPDLEQGDGSRGGYGGPWTFGMRADCGGWVDDPNLCGAARTDGRAPFDNPNPVLIPPAYATPEGRTSIEIVAGVTVQDRAANAGAGTSNATAGQKNILAITLRDDLEGVEPLQPLFVGLGDVSSSVSYVAHEH